MEENLTPYSSLKLMPTYKVMKTLEEHNLEIIEKDEKEKKKLRIKNGIECPDCRKELYDTNPEYVIIETAGVKHLDIECDCGFKGDRLV